MKKYIWSVLILFFVIQTISAQNRSFNLNEEWGVHLKNQSILDNSSTPAFENATRVRQLIINPLIQHLQSIQVNDTILLDLFENKQYKATIDKIQRDVNGTSVIRARIVGQDYGHCVISTFKGKSFMTIEIPGNDELYMSKYDHKTNRYFLLQIDKEKQKKVESSPPLIPQKGNQLKDDTNIINNQEKLNLPPSGKTTIFSHHRTASPSMAVDETHQDTITMMIVYTPAAAAWSLDNEAGINNTIAMLMANSQLVLDNSHTLTTLQLVYSAQVNYTERNDVMDLENLKEIQEGNMDEVHNWRNTYGADLVVLLENIDFVGGITYLLDSSTGLPDLAFSLGRVQQSSWTYVIIHEIGHNMGCSHHKLQNESPGPGLYSYSAGWRWYYNSGDMYGTVMTYEDGRYFEDGIRTIVTPYFSNPDIQFMGSPVGHPTEANNAKTIRQTKSVVASYRNKPTEPSCPIPVAAGSISGKALVCQGEAANSYSVPDIHNATEYRWNYSGSGVIIANGNTYCISIQFQENATSGTLTVWGINDCGQGITSTLPVTVNPLPISAGPIIGTENICPGQGLETYTVPVIDNATSYLWTLPSGVTGTSTTNSIIVAYSPSAVSGNLTVKGVNDCGKGTESSLPLTVYSSPAFAGSIMGPSSVCQYQDSVTYTVPLIGNATSYLWTLPSGATGTSTTNSITIEFGGSAVSGNLYVEELNPCCESMLTFLPIEVNLKPSTPTISFNATRLISDALKGNQWCDNDGFIAGATSREYTPSSISDYYVVVSANGCTSNASNSISYFPTTVNQPQLTKTFRMYHNPTTYELIIERNGPTSKTDFDILNSLGKVVFSGTLVDKMVLQTSSFTSGLYMVRFKSGELIEWMKFLKN